MSSIAESVTGIALTRAIGLADAWREWRLGRITNAELRRRARRHGATGEEADAFVAAIEHHKHREG